MFALWSGKTAKTKNPSLFKKKFTKITRKSAGIFIEND